MKTLLSLLFLSFNTYALDLTLGIGHCDSSLDYCPKPIGKIAIGHDFLTNGNHIIRGEIEHFSRLDDSLINGDRGTELYFIEYKYVFSK